MDKIKSLDEFQPFIKQIKDQEWLISLTTPMQIQESYARAITLCSDEKVFLYSFTYDNKNLLYLNFILDSIWNGVLSTSSSLSENTLVLEAKLCNDEDSSKIVFIKWSFLCYKKLENEIQSNC